MLSGFVPSQAEVDKAVNVARNVKGVSKVQSSLRIK
jgi:osmotically-inducible protein OsmY